MVSLEMGKIKTEGLGEVQEFVDIVRLRRLALSLFGANMLSSKVRLRGRALPYDERTHSRVGATWTHHL
jgi:hypothetical protein